MQYPNINCFSEAFRPKARMLFDPNGAPPSSHSVQGFLHALSPDTALDDLQMSGLRLHRLGRLTEVALSELRKITDPGFAIGHIKDNTCVVLDASARRTDPFATSSVTRYR